MIDLAEEHGIEIDVNGLEEDLGVPVVPMIAIRKQGFRELLEAISRGSRERRANTRVVDYGALEPFIEELAEIIASKLPSLVEKYPARWLAIKLLEDDDDVASTIRRAGGSTVLAKAEEIAKEAEERIGRPLDEYIVEARYQRVLELVIEAC